MLDCERWTLTQSSGDAGVLVLALALLLVLGLELELGLVPGLELELGLVPGLELELGLVPGLVLVARRASSVAAAVCVAALVAVGVAVPVAVPVAVGVPDDDADAEGDGEVCREGDGEAVCLGVLLALAGGSTVGDWVAAVDWLADGLAQGELDGDGEGDGEGEGDGDGDGERDGDGGGVGVSGEGSAWHTVSVFDVVAVLTAGAACAVPSTPRVRKLPLSKVTAATLTCAKRIRIARLRCSSGLPCSLPGFGGD